MKSSDKFLLAIVVGIVLLVLVAFVVVLARPEPTYQAEDTAGGVAHNYLLALQQEDYGRAYGYLSPSLVRYPASPADFAEQVADSRWRFPHNDDEVSLAVLSEKVVGNSTRVEVRQSRFYGGGLFDSGQSISTFTMKLQQEPAGWKIVAGDRYFEPCWQNWKTYCD